MLFGIIFNVQSKPGMKQTTRFLYPLLILAGVFMLISSQSKSETTVWMIGDSTMAAKQANRSPESGWGEGLKEFVRPGVVVKNRAASGRSTLSYINEGRWKAVIDSIKPGDYLIIQFGHNDQKENPKIHADAFGSFQDHIRMFIESARSKGATPVVCTSIVRRHFDGKGTLKDTHGDYIQAARAIASATHTPCVDMEASTRKLVAGLGPEASKKLFTFTDTKQDSTHVSHYGATEFARLFVEEVKQKHIPMKVF